MKVGKLLATVGLATLITASTMAAPANAATVGPLACGSASWVSGSTEGDAQITYLSGYPGGGSCGTLGIRVYYTHVGGASWTAWKYSSWGGGYVSYNVGNSAVKSEHSASVGSLRWTSFR